MKVAVSLPGELFEGANETAARLGLNRSQLYARALEEFLRDEDGDPVTAKLDELADELGTEVGAAAGRLLIERGPGSGSPGRAVVGRLRRAGRFRAGLPAACRRRLLRPLQPVPAGNRDRRCCDVRPPAGEAPGNVTLPTDALPKPSVVNVTQLLAVDRTLLASAAGRLPGVTLREVDRGLRLVLGL